MDAFYGEIRLFPYTYSPVDWVPCDGRQLLIQQYQGLFAVIGTTYGGNVSQGVFNVPDLRGRTAYGTNMLTGVTVGTVGGSDTVTLNVGNMPSHDHTLVYGVTTPANRVTAATGAYLSSATLRVNTTNTNFATFATETNGSTVTMNQNILSGYPGTGGAHDNHQPYLGLGFFICVYGAEFPVRPN